MVRFVAFCNRIAASNGYYLGNLKSVMLVAELIKSEGTVNFHKNFLSHRSVNRFLRASYLNVISTYGSMRLSVRRAPRLVGVSHCSTYKDEETLMR